jgi:hypothetical protein
VRRAAGAQVGQCPPRYHGRRVHGARHGGRVREQRTGSEDQMNSSHARCPRERRCKARDAVTVGLAVVLGSPALARWSGPAVRS